MKASKKSHQMDYKQRNGRLASSVADGINGDYTENTNDILNQRWKEILVSQKEIDKVEQKLDKQLS